MSAGRPGPVSRERYVQALAGQDPIESMRKAPKRLKRLLKGASEKRLARRPAQGTWSIKEVLAHLADHEVVLGSRYRMVAAMDLPAIPGYDQDAFVERLGVDKARAEDLLKDFAAVRKANMRLLARLPEGAMSRFGVHSERGEESLHDMVVMYAGHDRIHEEQIGRLLARERAERSKKGPKPRSGAKGRKRKARKTGRLPSSASPTTPAEAAAIPEALPAVPSETVPAG